MKLEYIERSTRIPGGIDANPFGDYQELVQIAGREGPGSKHGELWFLRGNGMTKPISRADVDNLLMTMFINSARQIMVIGDLKIDLVPSKIDEQP